MNHTKKRNKPMRFELKRKKENEFSFYVLHPNQLLSEVLFTTAGLFPKNSAILGVLSGFAFNKSMDKGDILDESDISCVCRYYVLRELWRIFADKKMSRSS